MYSIEMLMLKSTENISYLQVLSIYEIMNVIGKRRAW